MTTWILLRGLARESRHWGTFPDVLQQLLPQGHQVKAIDLPGNGRLHALRSPGSVGAMVEACRTQLAADGIRGPYVVLGLSLGAMVALQWSLSYPQELEGVVLVNGSFGGLAPFWRRLRPRAWWPLLMLLRTGMHPLERETRVMALSSRMAAADAMLPRRWADYAVERPVSSSNALRQLLAAARYRAPRNAPQVPVLLLASEGDGLVSPLCSIKAAGHWSALLQVHPEAGHDLALDAPDWLAARAATWWRAVKGRTPSGGPAAGRAGGAQRAR